MKARLEMLNAPGDSHGAPSSGEKMNSSATVLPLEILADSPRLGNHVPNGLVGLLAFTFVWWH